MDDIPDALPAGQYAVYALLDPTDQLVYYVGQTRNPRQRLVGHFKKRHHQGKKAEWVRSLKQNGQKPLMQILEIVPDKATALAKEQEWIRHFIEQGRSLFNAEAHPRQAREVIPPLRRAIIREVITPLRQEIIIVAGFPITFVWLPDNRVAATLNSLCAMLGIHPNAQVRLAREHGIILWGPPPATLIDPISPQELRATACAHLQGYWRSRLETPEWMRTREYQAYTVLTICRAFYTLEHGALCSKPQAAAWARAVYPDWRPMIERALAWRTDHEPEDVTATMAFLRAALKLAQERCAQDDFEPTT